MSPSELLEYIPFAIASLAMLVMAFRSIVSLLALIFVRGKHRHIVCNLLIGFSTVLTILLMTLKYLPLPSTVKEAMSTPTHVVLESMSVSLNSADELKYAIQAQPALESMCRFNYPSISPELVFETCVRDLQKAIEEHPKDKSLELAALAMSARFNDTGHKDRELEIWQKVLSGEKTNSAASALDASLPNGWFKDELAKSFAGSDYAIALEKRRAAQGKDLVPRLWLFSILTLAIGAAGAFFLFGVLKKGGMLSKELVTAPGVKFSGRIILSIALVAFYVSLVFGFIVSAVSGFMPRVVASSLSYAGSDLVMLIAILLSASAWILKPSGVGFLDALHLRLKARDLPLRLKQGGISFLIVSFITSVIVLVQANVFHTLETVNPIVVDIQILTKNFNLAAFLMYGLMTVVLAPLLEEIFFRGIVYQWLREVFDVMPACIISAALFAFCHFDPMQLPFLMTAGIVFALTYEKSKSLVSSMIAHALSNAFFLLSVFLVL